MNREKELFFNPRGEELSVYDLARNISEFINCDPSSYYKLVIGTDSQVKKMNGEVEVDFVTAVVIHRVGKGAKYFWRKKKMVGKHSYLRERIYTETTISLETAHNLVPLVRELVSPSKYDLEIHIDVGPLGPTRELIKEVVGMVNGNGYKAKTKPDSWGASSVADKYT